MEFSPELLATCDKEPIHIPGAVQPHGLLLVLGPDGELAGSAGDRSLLPDGDLSEGLSKAIGSSLDKVGDRLPASGPAMIATSGADGEGIDIVGHRSGDYAVIEIEPSDRRDMDAVEALASAQALASRLDAAQDIGEACQEAAKAVRALTGYDRIMVYRFLDDGSGDVIAEAKSASIDSLLHHRFPASDIPRQARDLYARNHVRVIPDVRYEPAPLQWLDGKAPPEPLDLSDSHLRSVSPVHIQYLKNMSVEASASISIMVAGELWGLIACHHSAPRPLGYVHREMGRHVGQLLGVQIGARQRAIAQFETVRLSQRREELANVLSGGGSGGIEGSMLRHPQELMRLIPCDGLAVVNDGEVALAGSTPPEEAIEPMIGTLAARSRPRVFATHRLVDHLDGAEAFSAAASGAVICSIRSDPPLAIAWFRAEQVQTIDWAGNPHKPVDVDTGALTPRKSFDLWRETVRDESRRWSTAEIEAAERVRQSIMDLLDKQEMQRLNLQLRRTLGDKEELLVQKDLLMREVHHRVQNSLQLVNAMLHVQGRESESDEVGRQFDLARQRLTAVAMVHRRLWRADTIGDVRLDSFIGELIEGLAEIWGDGWQESIELHVAPITLPTDLAIPIGLIVTELMTNAVKYAYGGSPGPVVIDASETGGKIRLTISDRGIGFDPKSRKESFGTRFVNALIAQLDGEVVVRNAKPGARVELSVPLPVNRH